MAGKPVFQEGVGNFIIRGLLSGVLAQPGNQSVAWLLRLIIDDRSPDIAGLQAQVSQLGADLKAIAKQLKDIDEELKKIGLEQQWLALVKDVDPIVLALEDKLEAMATLKSGDVKKADELAEWSRENARLHLITIRSCLDTGTLANPGRPGLLRLYALKCLQVSRESLAYGPRVTGAGSPLDSGYRDLENYFRDMINLQIQLVTLGVNGWLAADAREDGRREAKALIANFQTYLDQECQEFLWAVESYVVGYCRDDALLDLFRESIANADPIRRADDFVADYRYDVSADGKSMGRKLVETFRARVWGATSTNKTLDTTSFVPLPGGGAGEHLVSNTGFGLSSPFHVPLSPTSTWHVVFPPDEGGQQWSLFRHSFVDPPDGTWSLVAANPDGGTFDTLIDPFAGDAYYYNATIQASSARYVFDEDAAPSRYRVTLTTRTQIVLHTDVYGIVVDVRGLEHEYNPFYEPMTLETWVRPDGIGTVMARALWSIRPHKHADGGSFALALGPNFIPYAVLGGAASWDDKHDEWFTTATSTNHITINDGQWHHLAATLHHSKDFASREVKLYLDGEPLPVETSGDFRLNMQSVKWEHSVVLLGGPPLDVKEFPNGFEPPYFSGTLSESRLWKTTRSGEDIRSSMRRRAAGNEPGLTGLWNLDFGSMSDRAGALPNGTFAGDGSGKGAFVRMERDWLVPPHDAPWRAGAEPDPDPSLTVWGSTTYLGFRKGNNTLQLLASADWKTWSPVLKLLPPPFQGSPALAIGFDYHGTAMLLAFRSADGTNALAFSTSSDGKVWTNARATGSTLRGTPAITPVSFPPPTLFRSNDASDTLWSFSPGSSPQQCAITLWGSPSLTFTGRHEYAAFRASDESHRLFLAKTGSSGSWRGQRGWPVVAPDGTTDIRLHGSPSLGSPLRLGSDMLTVAFNWQGDLWIATVNPDSVHGEFITAVSLLQVKLEGAMTAVRLLGSPSLLVDRDDFRLAFRTEERDTFCVIRSADGSKWSDPVYISQFMFS